MGPKAKLIVILLLLASTVYMDVLANAKYLLVQIEETGKKQSLYNTSDPDTINRSSVQYGDSKGKYWCLNCYQYFSTNTPANSYIIEIASI